MAFVGEWFDAISRKKYLLAEVRAVGARADIAAAQEQYQKEIGDLKEKLAITEEDIQEYQIITGKLANLNSRHEETEKLLCNLGQYVKIIDDRVEVEHLDAVISFRPALDGLPAELGNSVDQIVQKARTELQVAVCNEIESYYKSMRLRSDELANNALDIKKSHNDLIERNKRHEQLEDLVQKVSSQQTKLSTIEQLERQVASIDATLADSIAGIEQQMRLRSEAFVQLQSEFAAIDQTLSDIEFSLEYSFDESVLNGLGEKFDRRYARGFGNDTEHLIDINYFRSSISDFMGSLESGSVRVKSDWTNRQVASDMLSATEELRFSAILEGDKIGGFSPSSMTPGKRALFALTLMLSESDGTWPLLIDQPEDDLDSRSIYEQIVPYIVERKKERQIIMVTHNANLAIGADSEQLIVANKHGQDRRNRNGQTFEYRTGSIECTKPKANEDHVLDSCGIREHACEILDGGEEAFEKRRSKYRL